MIGLLWLFFVQLVVKEDKDRYEAKKNSDAASNAKKNREKKQILEFLKKRLPSRRILRPLCHPQVVTKAHHQLVQEFQYWFLFWCGYPVSNHKYVRNLNKAAHQTSTLTWTILMADFNPDWICPKCMTPVTPTISSIPSQWLGLLNLSSFSSPQGLAPDPQLK